MEIVDVDKSLAVSRGGMDAIDPVIIPFIVL
jgi:hypothetical protein